MRSLKKGTSYGVTERCTGFDSYKTCHAIYFHYSGVAYIDLCPLLNVSAIIVNNFLRKKKAYNIVIKVYFALGFHITVCARRLLLATTRLQGLSGCRPGWHRRPTSCGVEYQGNRCVHWREIVTFLLAGAWSGEPARLQHSAEIISTWELIGLSLG